MRCGKGETRREGERQEGLESRDALVACALMTILYVTSNGCASAFSGSPHASQCFLCRRA